MGAGKKIIIGFLLLALVLQGALALKTFHVQETDLVKVFTTALDPDNDTVTITYSEPLDEQGEWQTEYGDAGTYTATITASDGVLEKSEDVTIIVAEKNRPPVLTEKKLIVKEQQTLDLQKFINDPNTDFLTYTFERPFDESGIWQPDFDDESSFITTFTVSDGEFTETFSVEIEVLSTNQPPEIKNAFSGEKEIEIFEGETLNFFAEGVDNDREDREELTYQWSLDEEILSKENEGEYFLDYENAGNHTLQVKISDGEATTEKIWPVLVKNTNRAPEFSLAPMTVQEGEKISLVVPERDIDGDALTYTFPAPFDERGIWQVYYNEGGEYELEVIASDRELSGTANLKVTVLNVDRAPTIELPEYFEAREGEESIWEIAAEDPDDDKLLITLKNAPAGVIVNQTTKTITWKPTYEELSRSRGFFSNLLNAARLEHLFLKKKKIPWTVEVCGLELCTEQETQVIIYNTNRAPHLFATKNLTMRETETIKIVPETTDPDGDFVSYLFSEPLGKQTGEWETSSEDEGTYTIDVTATDGKAATTVPVTITVLKKNRAPTLKIKDDELVVNEGQEFTVAIETEDADEDNVTVILNNLPEGASFDGTRLVWTPSFATVKTRSDTFWNRLLHSFPLWNKYLSPDETVLWLEFVASDGEIEAVHPVKVTVKNVNQKPELIDFLPAEGITVGVQEPMLFHVAAKDSDNEPLEYRWEFGWHESDVGGTDTIERTFLSPGRKKVTVTVSDGWEEVEKTWKVLVEERPVQQLQEQNIKVYVIKG
ncbi:MAG: PKD domain-containing protein [Nanoarchaeota archaeon]|nr:PKD domain-containing protein [Nanoarchaeota archaeon]